MIRVLLPKVDSIDYDKWQQLCPEPEFYVDVARPKAVKTERWGWIPRSQLCEFQGVVWVTRWFAEKEGIEEEAA